MYKQILFFVIKNPKPFIQMRYNNIINHYYHSFPVNTRVSTACVSLQYCCPKPSSKDHPQISLLCFVPLVFSFLHVVSPVPLVFHQYNSRLVANILRRI